MAAEVTAAEAQTNDIVAFHTAEALSLAGVAISDETSSILYEVMLRAVRAAYSQARSDTVQAPLDMLPPPETPPPARSALSLRGLFKSWKTVATVTAHTAREAE